MKRLILLRHAKSSWGDERLADHDRPLAPRGERDAPRIGERLARHINPELIVSSTAERAVRTAKLVARALELPPERIRLDATLYLATPAELTAAIAALDERLTSVLLVGHNPGLTDLVRSLLPDLALEDLPTCAVVAVDFEATRWGQLSAAKRRLTYYDFPKNPDAPVVSD